MQELVQKVGRIKEVVDTFLATAQEGTEATGTQESQAAEEEEKR